MTPRNSQLLLHDNERPHEAFQKQWYLGYSSSVGANSKIWTGMVYKEGRRWARAAERCKPKYSGSPAKCELCEPTPTPSHLSRKGPSSHSSLFEGLLATRSRP